MNFFKKISRQKDCGFHNLRGNTNSHYFRVFKHKSTSMSQFFPPGDNLLAFRQMGPKAYQESTSSLSRGRFFFETVALVDHIENNIDAINRFFPDILNLMTVSNRILLLMPQAGIAWLKIQLLKFLLETYYII